jgi:hypothetical protein
MARRKTHEEYENELFEKEIDYWPLEQYKGALIPIKHKCLHDHVWNVKPNDILRGRGCPECDRNIRRKTTEEYKTQLSKDIVLLEEYINDATPILHRHTCGHEWKVNPNSVLRGSSCPKCAKTGFDPSLPAILYLVCFHYLGETYYKIGITSRSVHKRFGGDWNKYDMQIISEKHYSVGAEARSQEQAILSEYRKYKIDTGLLQSGNTETFSCYLPIKNGF